MNEFLQQLLLAVITAGVPVLITFLVKLLNTKRDEIATSIDNVYGRNLLYEITDIISKATVCTTQTFVDSLKKEDAFTKEAAQEAFEKTVSSVRTLLSDEMKEFITQKYGDLDTFLTVQIESAVKQNKE